LNLTTLEITFESQPSNIPIDKFATLQQLLTLDISYKHENLFYYFNIGHLTYKNNMLICNDNIAPTIPVVVNSDVEYINIISTYLPVSFTNNLPSQLKKLRIFFHSNFKSMNLDNLPYGLQELEICSYKNEELLLPKIKLPFGCKLNLIKI
jgi:hypothetical protein